MKNGKEKIMNYCNQFDKFNIEHMEQAKENKLLIEQKKYSELNGCPSNFGLDNYEGLCEIEKVPSNKQLEQCEKCWIKALNS